MPLRGGQSRNSSPNFSNFLLLIRQAKISASSLSGEDAVFPWGSWEFSTTPMGFKDQINQLQGCFIKEKKINRKGIIISKMLNPFLFFLLAGNRKISLISEIKVELLTDHINVEFSYCHISK